MRFSAEAIHCILAESSFEGRSVPAEENLLLINASPVTMCSLTMATKPVIVETLFGGCENAPWVVMSSSSTSKGKEDTAFAVAGVGVMWTGRPAQALVLEKGKGQSVACVHA